MRRRANREIPGICYSLGPRAMILRARVSPSIARRLSSRVALSCLHSAFSSARSGRCLGPLRAAVLISSIDYNSSRNHLQTRSHEVCRSVRFEAACRWEYFFVLLLRCDLAASSVSGHHAELRFPGLRPCPFYGAQLPDSEPHTSVPAGPSWS